MKSARAKKAAAALALLTLAAAAWSFAHAKSEEQVNRARFAKDGSAARPIEWRQWVRVGTRYKTIGLNILDQKLTKTPEILNAYVEPSAMAVYNQTGQWPEGNRSSKSLPPFKSDRDAIPRPSFAAPGSEMELSRAATLGSATWSRIGPLSRAARPLGLLQLRPSAGAVPPDCSAHDHLHIMPCDARLGHRLRYLEGSPGAGPIHSLIPSILRLVWGDPGKELDAALGVCVHQALEV